VRRHPTLTYTSDLVFDAPPTAGTLRLRLLDAPDGDEVFSPFDEP
jgi:hypothetical protein